MATHSFVLLSMTAHEIISQQWVKVPYFPVFDVVDKMGEKQFGNTQIASNLPSKLRVKYQKHSHF